MRIVTFGSALFGAVLVLSACGGGGGTSVTKIPDDQARRVTGVDNSGQASGGASGRPGEVSTQRKVEDGPYIQELWIHPDPPLSYQSLRADPRVENPAGGFIRISYKWQVNGEELMGEEADSLPAAKFDKGDTIGIEVTAEDVNGRKDSHLFQDIRVANSKPVISSRIGDGGSLDGFVFKASDPDGDAIRWRVEGAPSGVSIGRTSGVFRVATGQTYQSGAYSITVVASDGDGGEGTLEFQASLSGGQRGRVVVEEVEDGKVVSGNSVSEKEYLDRTEELIDEMDTMTDEELQKFLDRSVSDGDLEAAAASEVGSDVTPSPPGTR